MPKKTPFKLEVVLVWGALIMMLFPASTSFTKLKRLTVVNMSGLPIDLRLSGSYQGYYYYLRVPAGDRTTPFEKTFTVQPDNYSATVFYQELWDPVYGYQCTSKSQNLDLTHNTRVIVFECTRRPANNGEPPAIVKFGAGGRR